MSRLWLSETDMEVACFHPVCGRALQEALVLLHLDSKYQIEHHRYVGSLEMDFVISNIRTRKILCVVEVKRTIPAVYSSRYQYQTMNYVQSLRDAEKETNYYILTNLECSCLFLYSNQRQNVYDQLIQPGYVFTHRFEDVSEEIFRRDLALHFKELIQRVLDRDTNYLLSFSNFAAIVQESMPNLIKWNSSLAFMFYEYIRGSFRAINRNGLADRRFFRDDIAAICREASRINFKGIFGMENAEYNRVYKPQEMVLGDLYRLGQSYQDAELICNVMHQVISAGHTHEGEVPTDIELAQVLLSIVKTYVPQIGEGGNITDPAAGSGTLLSAATTAYPDIQPCQIQANDINERLLQLLSLRMGLKFASVVQRNNSPLVQTNDISNLDKEFFNNTKVVVLNPPYLSAVAEGCGEKKNKLARRIRQLTGLVSKTNIGQAPLECPFIELVANLVQPGTIIACIIPNTHLSALGVSEVEFRKFLLNDFGLSMIFNYPQTNLFDDVAQNTSIFIGKAFEPQEKIKFVQSLAIVSELQQEAIAEAIANINDGDEPVELANGLVGYLVSGDLLMRKVSEGWKFLDSVFGDVHSFVNEHIVGNPHLFNNITTAGYGRMYRGKVGNSGGSDLLYLTTKQDFYNECCDVIKNSLKPGLRNSDYNNYMVGNGDQQFFDIRGLDPQMVKNVINNYVGKQRQERREKTVDEWYEILRKESQHSIPANSVLLPRGTRRLASTFITTAPTYVSTNLVCIETADITKARILSSWMCSIFYQLQLEIYSKNQNGMRKLEAENIKKTFVPLMNALSQDDIDLIVNTPINDFYDLRNPEVREIDRVWARIMTRNEEVEDLLNEALRYLTILANNREA